MSEEKYVPTPEEVASNSWEYCFQDGSAPVGPMAYELYYKEKAEHAHHQ